MAQRTPGAPADVTLRESVIRALVAWGNTFRATLAVHQVLRMSGRRGESLVDDVTRLREVEGAARFN